MRKRAFLEMKHLVVINMFIILVERRPGNITGAEGGAGQDTSEMPEADQV